MLELSHAEKNHAKNCRNAWFSHNVEHNQRTQSNDQMNDENQFTHAIFFNDWMSRIIFFY